MTISLEYGKRYVMRNEMITNPILPHDRTNHEEFYKEFCYTCRPIDNACYTWRIDGGYSVPGNETQFDIVAECVTAAQSEIEVLGAKVHATIEAAIIQLSKPLYTTGEKVDRAGGDYTFPGTVIAVFTKLDGINTRYAVEDDRGTLFIMSAKSMKLRV